MSTASSVSGTSARSSRSTKIVKLRLSPESLTRIVGPAVPLSRKASKVKSSPLSISTPAPEIAEPSTAPETSESNSTPVPSVTPSVNTLAPPPDPKRKGIPGPKPGTKRSLANTLPNGEPKPKGKPGPKKKPRLEDGTIAPVDKNAPVVHKLGPKANQGAINAGLRALDRSGKPCRKWSKKGFSLKSFTGISWEIPSWTAPHSKSLDANGEQKSDSTSMSADSLDKNNNASTIAESEKSNSGDVDMSGIGGDDISSPVTAVATPA